MWPWLPTFKLNVTVPGKTNHFVIISDFKILVPCCIAHFALHNSVVRFTIACIVHKLRESKYEHLINEFLAENGAKLWKVRATMFSIYYVCSHDGIIHTSHKIWALYISPPTLIANETIERLPSLLECRYTTRKSVRLKLAWGLAMVPYYIEACLLRSPYFVISAVLLVCTKKKFCKMVSFLISGHNT